MTDRSVDMSSSFFSSPGQASQCATPQQPPAQTRHSHYTPNATPSAENQRGVGAAANPHAGVQRHAAGLAFDASGTPMPGMLSFTPALGSAAAVGRANSFFSTPSAAQQQQQQLAAQRLARGADPQMAAPAPHPYSTTPSLAVPLDFPTPRVQPRAQMARNAAAATAAAAAAAAAAAMQFPNYRPHAAAPGTMGAVGTARINGPIPLSQFASGLPSAAGGRSLGAAGKLHFAALHGGNVTGLSVGEAASMAPLPGGPVRIARAPLRALIQSCLARGHLGGAVFYADKLATLEGFSDASVLLLATAYARDRQHQRAVHLLRKHKLLQFPRGDLAEWRRQQQDHERRQLQRQQQAQSRPAGASAADDEDDTADPLSVRMECLYLGVQSLLEMKAVEEALAACLPESKENAAQLGMREAQEWEAQLAHVLAAIAPVQPDAAAAGDEHSAAAAAAAAATTVREIIGEDETALVLALLKYHALQREKAASAARQRKVGQSSSALHGAKQAHGTDDVLMSPAIGLGLDAHSVPLDDEADYDGPIDLCSSLCFARGSLYESQSNKYKSILWYKLSLRLDVRNHDAFERLTSRRMLTAREEQELFRGALRFPPKLDWLKYIWLNRIDGEQVETEATQQQQQQQPIQMQVQSQHTGSLVRASASGRAAASSSPSSVVVGSGSSLLSRYQLLSTHYNLSDNVDLLSSVVAHRYNQGEYLEALELCEKVQEIDPFHLGILPTFLACLVATQQKSRLYFVAHRLVAAYPDRAVAWHAVGCYYLLLGALDVARRFFYKATRIDGLFPYAWLGFGHTFSYQDESEQALLSYRTAQRLFEGAHTPLLCMGQEYLKTNHLVLAEHFLAMAQRCHPHDPLAHNETGVIAFKNGEFQQAVRHFLRCIQLVKPAALANWEATLFNLGHAYRKLKRYPEAISAYNRALSVSSRSFSILCALGFTYHLQGQLQSAIAYYHKALGLHPRDTFATDMLDRALKEVAEEDFDI